MSEMDLFAPLASLQWVERDRLRANDYNPNKVSEDNLKLLTQSILTNGWTLPIVVRPDYTIIDGFHRWTVAGREPLLTRLGGKVPVVIVDHHGDGSADRCSPGWAARCLWSSWTITEMAAPMCTAPSPTTAPAAPICWNP